MADSLAAIVLAAGAGTRLRPLTLLRPKSLCPVDNVPLVDWSLATVADVVGPGPASVAVNAHHGAEQVAAHVAGRAHVSVEEPVALGTAGAVANLRPWLDGRAALVVNADTWTTIDLGPVVEAWDGERVLVVVVGADVLHAGAGVVASILPTAAIDALPAGPAGLYEVCWRQAQAAGRLDVRRVDGLFVACDRPRDYLGANLLASGGRSVIGDGAEVEGEVVRSVVWPGAVVHAGERLVDAIRADERMTVLVR